MGDLENVLGQILEMFKEIDGDFDDMAVRTFKVGLPTKHDLRKSLTKEPVRVCVDLWTALMNTRGSRKTNSKARGKVRLSLRR